MSTRMLHRRFGRLVVVEQVESTKHRKRQFRCKCDCGATTIVRGSQLRTARATSCGCYQRERAELGQILRWAQVKMAKPVLSG